MIQLVHEIPEDINILTLSKESAHRVKKVLRKRPGDEIHILDPWKNLMAKSVLKEHTLLEIVDRIPTGLDPHLDLRIWAGNLKTDRLEEAGLRCFELGLKSFGIFRAGRSQKPVSEKLVGRLERLAISGLEQSGRKHLPEIVSVFDFPSALQRDVSEDRQIYLFDLRGENVPVQPTFPATVFVGPEGGFTSEEVDLALGKGAKIVKLPGHVLRAETALVCLATKFLYQQ